MTVDHPILRNPLLYVAIFTIALVLLYVDHLPHKLSIAQILDNQFHHEDLMLLCFIGLLYSLWKLL